VQHDWIADRHARETSKNIGVGGRSACPYYLPWLRRKVAVMKTPNLFADASGRLALTRFEAARSLGISLSELDKVTKRGLLRPSRATRRPLYPVHEILRFLQDTTVQIEPEGDRIAGA
jgi:hypothetical protein